MKLQSAKPKLPPKTKKKIMFTDDPDLQSAPIAMQKRNAIIKKLKSMPSRISAWGAQGHKLKLLADVTHFYIQLKRAVHRRRNADKMRLFLQETVRGHKFHSVAKIFMGKVNLLQQAMRGFPKRQIQGVLDASDAQRKVVDTDRHELQKLKEIRSSIFHERRNRSDSFSKAMILAREYAQTLNAVTGVATEKPTFHNVLTKSEKARDEENKRKRKHIRETIDRYRVPAEIRNKAISQIVCENKNRWGELYEEYKTKKEIWSAECQNWRMVCTAYGPENKDLWPTLPPVPDYPECLTDVSESRLKTIVVTVLKRHNRFMQLPS